MNDLAAVSNLPAVSLEREAQLRELDALALRHPQVEIATHHVLHAGLYARTITVPRGVLLTSALMKIPTLVIVNGDVTVSTNDEPVHVVGYNVLTGSKYRKVAYLMHEDTQITMVFPTRATTVEDAENEFTDEAHLLFSRSASAFNTTLITGENP